ncbi:hypothetical protein [Streptomyces inhibens]|uniref:hypothetical protein n=1 Tax=Streptomyces inhibens TaxID=2293571 RepID=UPI001EE6F67D|nr:hypothetical protein [Streptomyces inhibens]UKY54782.1 hypothetical protein KI385_42370 [Streptomyces inhibens]
MPGVPGRLLRCGHGGQYLPEIRELEYARFTPLSEVVDALDAHTVLPFPIPYDFSDGFWIAYWRRPEFYLDPVVRQACSAFAQLPPSVVEPAMAKLRAALDSGAWRRRHADLLDKESVDYGYRLLIAGESFGP